MRVTEVNQDVSKRIETINHLIKSRKELIASVEILIQDAIKRMDVSEKSKKLKNEEYNSIIEYSKNIINSLENELSELKE